MNAKFLFSTKSILALLLAASFLVTAALFVYTQMDNLVNVDLYRYGLQFNELWASDYWYSYSFFLSSIECSLLLVAATFVVTYAHSRGKSALSRWTWIFLPIAAVGFVLLSNYFVLRIDSIVNITLYKHGLQLESSWINNYYGITRTTLTLTTVAIAIFIGSSIITWVATTWKMKTA